MSSIYQRGDQYYIRFKDAEGRWVSRAAGTSKEDAKKTLRAVERGLRDAPRSIEPPKPRTTPAPTLASLAPKWLERRVKLGLRTVDDDHSMLTKHVLPVLGQLPVGEIRVRHIRDLVEALRMTAMALRSIRNVYGTLHKLFADLVVDKVIPATPCVLTKDQLPKLRGKNPEWRATAVFTRDEVELLLATDAIPEDRRVMNAILFLTGLRFGELAGLRWRDLDDQTAPLWRLAVAPSYEHGTRTETPRTVPVHPLLAEVLAAWKTEAFARLMGRAPVRDDLIVPSRESQMRSRHHQRNKLLEDLAQLGLRPRRVHDTRRTFITLCRVDGARKDVLEQITHAPRGNILDVYTTLPWPTLCEAVSVLKVRRLAPDEVAGRSAALGKPRGEAPDRGAPGTPGADFVTAVEAKAAFVQKSWKRHANSAKKEGGGAGSRTRVRKHAARTSTRRSR